MATRLFHPAFGRRGVPASRVRLRTYPILPRRPSWLFRFTVVSAALCWLAWLAAVGSALHG